MRASMLVKPFPRTSSASTLLRMDAANAHFLTPIPNHVNFQLLLDSKHLIFSLYPENSFTLHLEVAVVGLDLFLCSSLVRAQLGIIIEVCRQIFKDYRVVHEDLFVPTRLLWVRSRWDGAYVCSDGRADRGPHIIPLKIIRLDAADGSYGGLACLASDSFRSFAIESQR